MTVRAKIYSPVIQQACDFFQWKDGSNLWQKLYGTKDTNALQTSGYAISHKIYHQQYFNWWVCYVLKNSDKIIVLVNTCNVQYLKIVRKFGIQCPKTIKESYALDKKNGDRLWADAIVKYINIVKVTFKTVEDNKDPSPGNKFMECHMVFSV